MIAPADFKIRFPEFDSIDDARIQVFIDDAVLQVNETYWGDKYNMGLYYLTAHYLYLAEKSADGSGSGSGGAVASRAVDGVSVSYNNMTPDNQSDAYYASTAYGQRYMSLMRTLGVASASV